jgi:hypothetical protein
VLKDALLRDNSLEASLRAKVFMVVCKDTQYLLANGT